MESDIWIGKTVKKVGPMNISGSAISIGQNISKCKLTSAFSWNNAATCIAMSMYDIGVAQLGGYLTEGLVGLVVGGLTTIEAPAILVGCVAIGTAGLASIGIGWVASKVKESWYDDLIE